MNKIPNYEPLIQTRIDINLQLFKFALYALFSNSQNNEVTNKINKCLTILKTIDAWEQLQTHHEILEDAVCFISSYINLISPHFPTRDINLLKTMRTEINEWIRLNKRNL